MPSKPVVSRKPKKTEYPSLLLLRKLVEPLARAEARLQEIDSRLSTSEEDAILQMGCFALAVSYVETALLDSREYHLTTCFDAYYFEKAEFSKEELFASPLTSDVYRGRVRKRVRSESYQSFDIQLAKYLNSLGIADPPLSKQLLESVLEIKESRNALLHNDLRVSEVYLEKAGLARRSTWLGARLPMDRSYVRRAINDCLHLLKELQGRIDAAYRDYTKVAALRRIWAYLFESQRMKFDDFWTVDELKDSIPSMKVAHYEGGLGSAERMLLSAWRYHFNGWSQDSVNISMGLLDSIHRRKLLFFLSLIGEISLE